MKLFRINSPLTALRALALGVLLLIAAYFLSALVGSFVPANSDWQEPDEGIELFVETNGVHVSLVIPISAAGEDLSDLIRPQDLTDPMLYGTHAMIGWGHEGVYRNAQTWADVRSGDVASAVLGSRDTLLHVYHLIRPRPTSYRKKFRVSRAQYRSIVAQIRASFRLDAERRSVAYPAYGANNIFYDAYGRYSGFHTCNEWTGELLREAGIKVGIWTPFAGGVMRWF